MKYKSTDPYNFLGLTKHPKHPQHRVNILPVPYEATTTYKEGTREGPHAILDASRQVELFDIELNYDASEVIAIETLPALEPSSEGPHVVVRQIAQAIGDIAASGAFPFMLGGEHSITLGAVQALKKKYKQLSVLQIDAHTDLRDSYEGSKYNHACIMRRIWDIGCRAASVGIRSGVKEDLKFYEKKKAYVSFGNQQVDMQMLLGSLGTNVYLTIDIDGFDPSVVPATGTPEPGGLTWAQVTSLIHAICAEKNVVGADLVELLPTPGLHASEFLAAKLVYRVISSLLRH